PRARPPGRPDQPAPARPRRPPPGPPRRPRPRVRPRPDGPRLARARAQSAPTTTEEHAMTPYAEALEQQLATVRFMSSPAGVEMLRSMISTQYGHDGNFSSLHDRLERTWVRRLSLGVPFWVDPGISAMLLTAGRALPWDIDKTIDRTMFPVPHGWV